jgi:D-3-phosphoglycerate dehydrogenase / 2-oxoglutarate reductase
VNGEHLHLRTMLYTDAAEFPLPPELLARTQERGIELRMIDGHDPAEIRTAGKDSVGIFLYRARVDAALLDAMPHCQALARVGTGYDLIDVEEARHRGVMVTNVPDFCTEELSDTVMLFVLAFARRLPDLLESAKRHHWMTVAELPKPRRLTERTLGIIGFGKSGQRTAEKAHAFGMGVRVWTRTSRPEALARTHAREVSFEEALACDYVSLHVPLTAATGGLINKQSFQRMEAEAILINISRGAVVDTEALVVALQEGRIAGAGLDVVDPAPLPADHPLWAMPNVLITSHSACISQEALLQSQTIAIDDAAAVLLGRAPAHPVPEMHIPAIQ